MSELPPVDLMFSTVAVVFEPTPDLPVFRITDEVLTNILQHPLNIGNSPGGQIVIGSPRDNIEIQLAPNKIDVRNVSGDNVTGEESIPHILHGFLQILDNPALVSYGINFVVELPVAAPAHWIANQLAHPQMQEYFGDNLASNRMHLQFQDGQKDVTLQIGVRGDGHINMNFNASENISVLPSQE